MSKDCSLKFWDFVKRHGIFGNFIIVLVVLITISIYAKSYVASNTLNFTKEDSFILFCLYVLISYISSLVIYLIIDNRKLKRDLKLILEKLDNIQQTQIDIEDDNIEMHKTTQCIISDTFNTSGG